MPLVRYHVDGAAEITEPGWGDGVGLLEMVRRALGGGSAAADPGAPAPDARDPAWAAVSSAAEAAPGDVVRQRQERAAGRLLDDERLRGGLTDEEFEPLLQWALGAIDQVVAGTAGEPEAVADERIDQALETIRRVLGVVDRALARRAEGSSTEFEAELRSLTEAVAPPLLLPAAVVGARARIDAALERLLRQDRASRSSARPDGQEDRAALTHRLAEALGSALQPAREGLP